MNPAKAYASLTSVSPLAPFNFQKRELKPKDVAFDILYCGVCHSDVEVIPISYINEAYDRMMKGDVRYRFVIDNSTLN